MKLSRSQLVIRYAAFAMLATFANLAAQRLVLAGSSGWYVAALMTGTGVGLIVKYALDKQWIFFDSIQSLRKETRKFSLYTLTGVGTTALFWGSETLFWLIGQNQMMREIGALIGLSAGYTIKYNLDHRFVFRQKDATLTGRSDGQD